jgi:carboxyl-terminal processing protease
MFNKGKFSLTAIFISVMVVLTLAAGCIPTFIRTTTSASGNSVDNELINEAYDVINNNYVVPKAVDNTKITQGAIKGMVDALKDPYSAYLTPEQFKLTTSDFAGQFQGIGAVVGLDNGVITIISPIPGSPAEQAGVKAGDVILAVDGKSVEGMSTQEVVLLVRGPKDTNVTLTLLHKGETQSVDITITRADIQPATVNYEMKGYYAYIQITQFSDRTDEDLTAVLKSLDNTNVKGFILDLRNNPGGLLTTVVAIASHFIDNGPIVSVIDRQGNKQTENADTSAMKFTQPVVVLVNEYSASGSEVLSGALQDYKRAVIAGHVTFGKGSVDQLIPLSDGSGIYITMARWATPNGNLIEGEGITPEYPVDWSAVDGIQWAIDYLNGLNK